MPRSLNPPSSRFTNDREALRFAACHVCVQNVPFSSTAIACMSSSCRESDALRSTRHDTVVADSACNKSSTNKKNKNRHLDRAEAGAHTPTGTVLPSYHAPKPGNGAFLSNALPFRPMRSDACAKNRCTARFLETNLLQSLRKRAARLTPAILVYHRCCLHHELTGCSPQSRCSRALHARLHAATASFQVSSAFVRSVASATATSKRSTVLGCHKYKVCRLSRASNR